MKCLVSYVTDKDNRFSNVDVDFLRFPPTLRDIRNIEAVISNEHSQGSTVHVLGWNTLQEDNLEATMRINIEGNEAKQEDLIEVVDKIGSAVYKVMYGNYTFENHNHTGWYLQLDSVDVSYPEDKRKNIRLPEELLSDDIKYYTINPEIVALDNN